MVGLLERAAGLRREDPPAVQLDKLEAMLALAVDDVGEAAPALADLLGIPAGDRYPPLELSPQQKKERTFRALLDQLAGLAAKGPVLALYEDVHWADPTTLELIGRVVEAAQRLPVLALVTFRPEFAPPWAGHGHVTALSLGRLGRRQGGRGGRAGDRRQGAAGRGAGADPRPDRRGAAVRRGADQGRAGVRPAAGRGRTATRWPARCRRWRSRRRCRTR